MAKDQTPGGAYYSRIAASTADELTLNEHLLAATRVVLPFNNARYDEKLVERSGAKDLALLQHLIALVRPAPKPVAGFPLHWDMVLALTRQRILVYKPRRGSPQPAAFLGSVSLSHLTEVKLATIPDRRGRTLALKINIDHGPRLMLDVLAGYRSDTEHFVETAQPHLGVPRLLG